MTGYPIGMALQQMVTHRGMVSSIGPIVPPLRGQQLDVKMVRRPARAVQHHPARRHPPTPATAAAPLYDPQTGKVLGIIDAVFVKAARESALTAPSGDYLCDSGEFHPRTAQPEQAHAAVSLLSAKPPAATSEPAVRRRTALRPAG